MNISPSCLNSHKQTASIAAKGKKTSINVYYNSSFYRNSVLQRRRKKKSQLPSWGAFHQAFCQCFSLTNLLSANQMQGFQ